MDIETARFASGLIGRCVVIRRCLPGRDSRIGTLRNGNICCENGSE
ncbi:MAG: hypothetical protein M0Q42_01325 [Xanthomonadales bacterium]|nr:hypothetical protein [Xanthomonadales bacterium]